MTISDIPSSSHDADTNYLVRQSMNTGYQWASLLAPPAYIAFVIARRGRGHLNANGVLRATWVGGLAGAGLAGGAAYARYVYSSEDAVRVKRLQSVYNTGTLRRNDHATIGGIVCAVLMPAIFWKRANVVNLVLGGLGIGNGIGLLVHHGRTLTGAPAPKLNVTIPAPPVANPNSNSSSSSSSSPSDHKSR